MSPATLRASHARARHSQTSLAIIAGLLALAAASMLVARGMTQLGGAVIFGGLIAIGETARVSLPGNRECAPLAMAGGLAYALALRIGTVPAEHDSFQVIVVMAAGVLFGAGPHAAAGRPVRLDGMTRRVLTVAAAALLFRPFAEMLPPADHSAWSAIGAIVGILLLAEFVTVQIAAVTRADAVGSRFWPALREEVRIRLPLGGAVGATVFLLTLAATVMGWYALPVCLAPLVVTQVAYRRYSGIRRTYLQTIRALSRVPEVGGYVEPDHSRRVSSLSAAIGRELGIAESRLLNLEYAALMHDIGQLSLRDPNPGGATVTVPATLARHIAERGAEVVRQTGVLDRVAEIMLWQAEPYRREAPLPPLESRIIRVANAYDDLTGGVSDRARTATAVQRIWRGSGREYDPLVVGALSRVVDYQ